MLQGDNSPKINSPDAATTTKTSHPHSGEKGNEDSVPGIHGNFIISELRGSQQGQARQRAGRVPPGAGCWDSRNS